MIHSCCDDTVYILFAFTLAGSMFLYCVRHCNLNPQKSWNTQVEIIDIASVHIHVKNDAALGTADVNSDEIMLCFSL